MLSKYNIFSFCAVCFCFFLTGCATIIHGTSQKIAVASSPTGATVSDGVHHLQTPAVIELKRKTDHILTISKPGYETVTIPVTHVVSSAVAANIFGPGFIGWGIDALTGAQWELVPETVSVALRPLLPWEKDKKAEEIAAALSEKTAK